MAVLSAEVLCWHARIEELEEELEAERAIRAKVEKQRADLTRELDNLTDRLEEAGGITTSQMEVNKKREAELQRLRRDLEETCVQSEVLAASLKKRHSDAMADLSEQYEALLRTRAKLEKEKQSLRMEVDELTASLESLQKAKTSSESQMKKLEEQLSEANRRGDDLQRNQTELSVARNRLTSDNADMSRQIEEAEARASQLSRSKALLQSQLEDLKKHLDEEVKCKHVLSSSLSTVLQECEVLKEQVEEEQESKHELQRLVSKLNSEKTHWMTKHETDAIQHADKLEDTRKKLATRLQEAEEAVEATQAKCSSLEKNKQRLQGEVEELCIDLEKASSCGQALDKKQQVLEKQLEDWKQKCEELVTEVEGCQKESRQHASELFKLKTTHEESLEQLEALRRENQVYQEEVADMTDQLSDGGKSVHELQKAKKKIEMEKEELQASLEESEAALEVEETKVLRLQLELSQAKGDLERRLQEKEEEMVAARKCHQRALESLQATLDVEVKGKAEGLKLKKKCEADINELELQVELLNKSNAELSKSSKKMQQQIKAQLEESVRSNEECREEQIAAERRCSLLVSEGAETCASLEITERSCKALEMELQDTREKHSDLNNQFQLALSARRKLEVDLQTLLQENEELQGALRGSMDKSNKASSELARVGEKLRLEQEHTLHLERVKKGLDAQIKDMSTRMDEAEQMALKGGKKIIQKLEGKVKEMELELDSEQKRHAEAVKTVRKNERRLKELLFQSEEDQKNQLRMQELVERLQNKLKAYKSQVEEAEEQANINLAKYRKTVNELDDAEERADIAETALTTIRTKNRGSFGKGHSSGYSMPYPGKVRSPSPVGSEGRGHKILNDDNESVNSLIPAYLNSLKKLMID
ncbi:myosin-16 isoform X2 [Pungitius pungitius]|uniref:myosin-16 isoform X2 n=1 Tax=Pungitius pungitius TaxID=134920 RepID=UPI002E163B92